MKKIWIIFWTFFKIGSFTFGGGFAMIPLIEREIVDKKKWITQSDMIDILTISQSFPGAVAVNTAIFIGRRVGGYIGALSALIGVILPSFLIIIIVAKIFEYISSIDAVIAALKGVSSAVIALLVVTALRVGKASIKYKISPLITVIALILLLVIGIHPIYIVMLGIALGLIIYGIKVIRKKKK
jgi:chromate transporter